MRSRRKYYLYLDSTEYSLLIQSLVQLKNKLIRQDRYTDCVDDLILKVMDAPTKRI